MSGCPRWASPPYYCWKIKKDSQANAWLSFLFLASPQGAAPTDHPIQAGPVLCHLDVLQARLGELEGELERRREEYEALNLAIEVLGEANAQLRQRFSPALNARAGGILSALTGGKYSKVALTREFEALVSQADDPTPRKALNLSQGTIDQVYLAVRLAVCREALPAKEPPPLILDDALVNFDDDRMKLALNYLRMVAKDRQVILFTCHSRERECLEKADGVNFICLQS